MLDLARIEELKAEVGEDDFAEVVGLFCDEVEEVLEDLDATPQEDLGTKLHFLKGSAQNVGLERVGALCLNEERRLRDDPTAQPDIQAIRNAYLTSKAQLLG